MSLLYMKGITDMVHPLLQSLPKDWNFPSCIGIRKVYFSLKLTVQHGLVTTTS